MLCRCTPAAAVDLDNINAYLRTRHPQYRETTIRCLYQAALSLKQSPMRGRIDRMDNTRELFVSPLPYVIVYRVKPEVVEILRVYHSAQNRR